MFLLVPAYLGCPGQTAIKWLLLLLLLFCSWSFSALTLLVGRQERHPAFKKRVVGCWRGYLSRARCRLAYGPADATATHRLFASVKSRLVLPFWFRLTQVVPEKGPLNGCQMCVSVLHPMTDLSPFPIYGFHGPTSPPATASRLVQTV